MLEFSYEVGVQESLIGGAAGAIVSVVWYLRENDPNDVEDLPQALVYIILGGLGVAALGYAIANPLLQIGASVDVVLEWLSNELQNGILGLRIAMAIFGAKALVFLGFAIDWTDYPQKKENHLVPNAHEADVFNVVVGAQHAFFLVAVVIVAVITIRGFRHLVLLAASWTLFFVADDWAILADSGRFWKGNMLRGQEIKIWAFSILLLVLVPYTVYVSGYVLPTFVVFAFLFGPLLTRWHYEKSYNYDRTRKDVEIEEVLKTDFRPYDMGGRPRTGWVVDPVSPHSKKGTVLVDGQRRNALSREEIPKDAWVLALGEWSDSRFKATLLMVPLVPPKNQSAYVEEYLAGMK